jgi:hypothetical protein
VRCSGDRKARDVGCAVEFVGKDPVG